MSKRVVASAGDAMKRPKIKRLNSPVHMARIDSKYDPSADTRLKPLDDVPIFANDGWFLMVDGKNQRSWYQIKGKAYMPNEGNGENHDLDQPALIRHFRWCLDRHEQRETDLGKEATDLLARSLRSMRRTPEAVALFLREQRQLQYCRQTGRDITRRMRSFRERGKAK